jgi:hypothetical protein
VTEPLFRTFVFDTTNAALWAEEVAREALLPVEVVPAPADSRAGCDLALITLPERAARLAEVLEAAGVPFRAWPADTPAEPQ